eukprot:6867622-Alexandrium_andersonii.AAC.1
MPVSRRNRAARGRCGGRTGHSIRDSPNGVPSARRLRRIRLPEARKDVRRRRLGAVSYTHLTLPTICSV